MRRPSAPRLAPPPPCSHATATSALPSPPAPHPQAEARLTWALARCHELGLRLTAARARLLECLAAILPPVTWETLAGHAELRSHCDPATISRALRLFHAAGLLRAIDLPHKVRGFLLNAPGSKCGIFICRCCGAIAAFPLDEPMLQSAARAAGANGFSWPEHEVTCHGLCSHCQEESENSPPPSKLSAVPARPPARATPTSAASTQAACNYSPCEH